MLMSVTKVNLVEATNYDTADIPITFLTGAEYRTVNDQQSSVAFSDIEMMHNEPPTAPVYLNIHPGCGNRWVAMHSVENEEKGRNQSNLNQSENSVLSIVHQGCAK